MRFFGLIFTILSILSFNFDSISKTIYFLKTKDESGNFRMPSNTFRGRFFMEKDKIGTFFAIIGAIMLFYG